MYSMQQPYLDINGAVHWLDEVLASDEGEAPPLQAELVVELEEPQQEVGAGLLPRGHGVQGGQQGQVPQEGALYAPLCHAVIPGPWGGSDRIGTAGKDGLTLYCLARYYAKQCKKKNNSNFKNI